MAEARLLLPKFHRSLIPYFALGIGGAKNRVYNYNETAITPAGLPGDPFTNKTTYSFAFQAGLGIIYQPKKSFGISLGYQYVNLGQAKLGKIATQTTSDYIKTGSIQTHNIKLGLIWFLA